jgi:acetyltransferase-like isoleucine patch superfamily enzyme
MDGRSGRLLELSVLNYCKNNIHMIKSILRKILSFGVPVNKITRPILSTLYHIHFFLHEVGIWFIRFIYFEPLFRSQCESVGKGLWMEKLPYIVNRGIIIIGENVRLSGKSSFAFSQKVYRDPQIIIGNNTFVGHETSFAAAKRISIGSYCYIAGGVYIADNDGHPDDFMKRRMNLPPEKEDVKEVIIGDDVWIGRQAVILKGVKIGDRSIVGARSLVTKDVPSDSAVGGNPAKIIKSL